MPGRIQFLVVPERIHIDDNLCLCFFWFTFLRQGMATAKVDLLHASPPSGVPVRHSGAAAESILDRALRFADAESRP
nr:hypothetical protein CFP56_28535 [Quercus suber]